MLAADRRPALRRDGPLPYAERRRHERRGPGAKTPDGRPVENGLRNMWVTETALTTALNTAFFAERVAFFSIVMGVALLLTGIGFLVRRWAARSATWRCRGASRRPTWRRFPRNRAAAGHCRRPGDDDPGQPRVVARWGVVRKCRRAIGARPDDAAAAAREPLDNSRRREERHHGGPDLDPPPATPAPPVFNRVLVGVDGSPEALEAARQAARLLDPHGDLRLLAAFDIAPAMVGGTGPGIPAYFDEEAQRTVAESALAAARATVGSAHPPRSSPAAIPGRSFSTRPRASRRLWWLSARTASAGRAASWSARPRPSWCTRRRARCWSRGRQGRSSRAASSSASTARSSPRQRFPLPASLPNATTPSCGRLLPMAARASTTRRSLPWSTTTVRIRTGSRCRPSSPLRRDADLLVVGSRGLHGLRSLGSVSERVAHQARSSVLIVRRGDDADTPG